MSAQHTQGPWGYTTKEQRCSCGAIESEYFKITSASWDVAIVAGTVLMPEQEANARLIAAAPDLLAVCEALIGRAEKYATGSTEGGALTEQLRAAIAKAVQS